MAQPVRETTHTPFLPSRSAQPPARIPALLTIRRSPVKKWQKRVLWFCIGVALGLTLRYVWRSINELLDELDKEMEGDTYRL